MFLSPALGSSSAGRDQSFVGKNPLLPDPPPKKKLSRVFFPATRLKYCGTLNPHLWRPRSPPLRTINQRPLAKRRGRARWSCLVRREILPRESWLRRSSIWPRFRCCRKTLRFWESQLSSSATNSFALRFLLSYLRKIATPRHGTGFSNGSTINAAISRILERIPPSPLVSAS